MQTIFWLVNGILIAVIEVLTDSGFIYSLYNIDDPDHARCLNVFLQPEQKIYLPTITLPEIAFLVRRSRGGEYQVSKAIRSLHASPLGWVDPSLEDFDRATDIMDQYRDAKLDLVDCVLMAMAERLNIQRIFTLDRRDFSLMKPQHCPAFELLP